MHRLIPALCMILVLTLIWGCSGTSKRPDDPKPKPAGEAGPPEFTQNRFKVYTHYRPQVQYRDFNGVFDIQPGSARVVRKFWKERFNELTRPGHYGEFFIEFYDYMSSFAQAYPAETRQKEAMLDSLEKSFHTFCLAVKIEKDFETFQEEQMKIYGD